MYNFNLMMNKYVQWADQLFPQFTFDDFVAKVEDLNKGPVKVGAARTMSSPILLSSCAGLVCGTRAPPTPR